VKRIDDLIGATVRHIRVSRAGKLYLWFAPTGDRYTTEDWDPMVVEIPREPKKRKAKR
jgi:hypothetical protein